MSTTSAMNTQTVVGVFESPRDAQKAIKALREAGYTERQIGVASQNSDRDDLASKELRDDDSVSDEATMVSTGAAIGAGAGALWGLGIVAGVLPGIGPAIVGGTLGILLSSAAAGAATVGVGVALASIGISDEEADYYEGQLKSGKTIVTVHGASDNSRAKEILAQYGGRD